MTTSEKNERIDHRMKTFWEWFFYGNNRNPGYRRIVDGWLIFHASVGLFASQFFLISLEEAARTVLLPLAGVFVGVSFAWGANANALLQSQEVEKMATVRGGLEEYAYTYQLAMLVILSALVVWGVAGLGFFDKTWPGDPLASSYTGVKMAFYLTVSVSLRESWHVALGAQMFLIARMRIREAARNKAQPETEE